MTADFRASSDPRLAGDLTARVRTVSDTRTGCGETRGQVRISDASNGRPTFNGHVVGVLVPAC